MDEAFRAFDRWCSEHDPDEARDIAENAAHYAAWAETNSIEKYLDAAWLAHPAALKEDNAQ